MRKMQDAIKIKKPVGNDPSNLNGNILLRGKWGYIRTSDMAGDQLRFVVTVMTSSGQIRKVNSRSAFSHDIKEALMYTPVMRSEIP